MKNPVIPVQKCVAIEFFSWTPTFVGVTASPSAWSLSVRSSSKKLLFLYCLLFSYLAHAQTIIQRATIKETTKEVLIELQSDQPMKYEAKTAAKPPALMLQFEKASFDKKFKAALEDETIRSISWKNHKDSALLQIDLEVDATQSITLSPDQTRLTIKIERQRSEGAPPDVRVAVLYHVKKAVITSTELLTLTNEETSEASEEAKGSFQISSKKGVVILSQKGKEKYRAASFLFSSKGALSEGKTVYRGSLRVVSHADGTFSVINILDVESYLLGVVSREMPSSWPQEALSAQAIAARTYALQRMGQYEAEGFDLFDTTQDQVYGGKSAEQKTSTLAVNETRGLAAVDLDGVLINALYFSTAGGCTEDNDAVFDEEPEPYLRSTKTEWDAESPNFTWTISFTKDELEQKLNAKEETKIGTLTSITLREKTAAGRWTWVDLEGSSGKKTVRGHQFRRAVGASKIKSTLFTMTEEDGTYTFDGNGYGHGVGMCQYSAKGMATAGYTHRAILRTFYGESMRLKIMY